MPLTLFFQAIQLTDSVIFKSNKKILDKQGSKWTRQWPINLRSSPMFLTLLLDVAKLESQNFQKLLNLLNLKI